MYSWAVSADGGCGRVVCGGDDVGESFATGGGGGGVRAGGSTSNELLNFAYFSPAYASAVGEAGDSDFDGGGGGDRPGGSGTYEFLFRKSLFANCSALIAA